MRECEENSRCAQFKEVSQLDLAIDSRLASCQNGTHVKHAGELKGHDSWGTTGQNFQSDQEVSSRLRLMTRSSREVESPKCPIWLKHDFSYSSYAPL